MSAVRASERIPPEAAAPSSFTRGVALVMAANAAMALYQWGIIVATARLTSPRDLGALTLGLALAAPLLTLSTSGLRLLQIRDVGLESSARHYVQARSIAVAAALAPVVVLTQVFDLAGRELLIALLVVAVRSTEAIADACWSFLLAVGDIPQLVRTLFARATASAGVFVVVLLATGHAAVALLALGVASTALLLGLELPRLRDGDRACRGSDADRGRPAVRLILLALPLGVASALTSLNMSVPRYVLPHERGIDSVAVFSAMASVFAIVSLFTAAVGQTAIPRLARSMRARRRRDFVRLLGVMLGLGLLAGLVTLASGLIAGEAFLTVLYGSLFATELAAFRWLLVALGVMCLVTFLQDGLTVLDWRGTQVVGFGIGAAVTALLCLRWVASGGITAAAQALAASALAQLVFFAAAVAVAYRRSGDG